MFSRDQLECVRVRAALRAAASAEKTVLGRRLRHVTFQQADLLLRYLSMNTFVVATSPLSRHSVSQPFGLCGASESLLPDAYGVRVVNLFAVSPPYCSRS